MKVLVTGAKGLLGTHICKELFGYHEVVGVDREEGTLRDTTVISRLLDKHTPDYVLHLAAKVGRLFGDHNAMDTIIDNAGLTANVAKACGERGVRLAYASTSEVYGDFEDRFVCEDDLQCGVLPNNLYGLSKRWGEEVSRLYAPSHLLMFRFGMPIGPGYLPGYGKAAIATFIWNAMKGKPLVVHKDTERSWCWVGDVANATRVVLEAAWANDENCGAWNIGRDDNPYTMEEIAVMICKMVGAPLNLIELVDTPPGIIRLKRQSTDRLRSLGWKPRVDFTEMLMRTYEWIKENQDKFE